MYVLNPKSCRDFIDDTAIVFPRFQRKQTWDDAKNFRLALSLFKGYPLGTVILHLQSNVAKDVGEIHKKFLLDGRQRRAALQGVSDPERLWYWAKTTLRVRTEDGKRRAISSQTSEQDLAAAFWESVVDYFGLEPWEVGHEGGVSLVVGPDEASGEGVDATASEEEPNQEPPGGEADLQQVDLLVAEPGGEGALYSSPGLMDLLELLRLVHPVTKGKSGLRIAFDYSHHLDGLPYVRADADGKKEVRVDRLLRWLADLPKELASEGVEYPPPRDRFGQWLRENFSVTTTDAKLETDLESRWPRAEGFMRALHRLDQRLRDTQIGYLELENASANDEKKIFEIINTEGTPLTAVEILSAQPAWNTEIDEPSDDILRSKSQLYEEMEIFPPPPNVVRWDVAATLIERLDIDFILGV